MARTAHRVEFSGRRPTAVIAGTARDCAKHLRRVLRKIDDIGAVFDQHAVVIVENDSIDDTRTMLFNWASDRPNVQIDTKDNLLPGVLKTQRIAYCRNRALAIARERYADFDFLVWVDMDEPIKSLRIDDFAQALAYIDGKPDICGLFANSNPRYYDIWALRHPVWCPSDCWAERAMAKERLWPAAATATFVHGRQIAIDPAWEPIEVVSAFNGMGIYRMAQALQSEYRGTTPDGTSLCEHVHFNKGLTATGKRLVIYPRLLLTAPDAHLALEAQSSRRSQRAQKLQSMSDDLDRFLRRVMRKLVRIPMRLPNYIRSRLDAALMTHSSKGTL